MLQLTENIHRSDFGYDKTINQRRYNEVAEVLYGKREKRAVGRPCNNVVANTTLLHAPERERNRQDRLHERLAEYFNESDLRMLKGASVHLDDASRIISLANKDPVVIGRILDRLAIGIPLEQAVHEGLHPEDIPPEPEVSDERIAELIQEYRGRKPPPENKDLSDEDWLNQVCGEIRKQLISARNHTIYDMNALLYRKCQEHLQRFRQGIRDATLRAKNRGLIASGPFLSIFWDLLRMEHPSHFIVCGNCRGTGNSPGGSYCHSCLGEGFKKVETRL
jgi:hypothetical protein